MPNTATAYVDLADAAIGVVEHLERAAVELQALSLTVHHQRASTLSLDELVRLDRARVDLGLALRDSRAIAQALSPHDDHRER